MSPTIIFFLIHLDLSKTINSYQDVLKASNSFFTVPQFMSSKNPGSLQISRCFGVMGSLLDHLFIKVQILQFCVSHQVIE